MGDCERTACYKEGDGNVCFKNSYAWVHGTECGDHKVDEIILTD